VQRPSGGADVALRPLVARAQNGDAQAFAALVKHFDHNLRALIFRLLSDRNQAEDVLQETYVKAFRALPGFRGDSSLGTWLYAVAYRACLDDARQSRSRRIREAAALTAMREDRPPAVPDPADAVIGQTVFVTALMSLPLEERAAVLLVDGQGLAYAAAADVLGVPVGTIASRLNRARPALRRILDGAEQRAEGK
jgi:RNA polymerase sigma-70 factor, ECF subfamily